MTTTIIRWATILFLVSTLCVLPSSAQLPVEDQTRQEIDAVKRYIDAELARQKQSPGNKR